MTLGRPFHVAVQAAIRDADGRWLVLRRAPGSRTDPDRWDLPGGKLEVGESLDEGLLREVVEETGLRVELERVLDATSSVVRGKTIVHLLFEARATGGEIRLSDEHCEHRWLPLEELATRALRPQVRDFVVAALRRPEPPCELPPTREGMPGRPPGEARP